MYSLSKTIIRVSHNEIYFFFKKYSICSLVLRISVKSVEDLVVFDLAHFGALFESRSFPLKGNPKLLLLSLRLEGPNLIQHRKGEINKKISTS
jgi:hypothetical protein